MADSWELEDDLRRLAPSLNLEDKVPLYGGGDVMDPKDNAQEGITDKGQAHDQMGQPRKSLRMRRKTWKLREIENAEGI